mgnify:CR=1 FL=1
MLQEQVRGASTLFAVSILTGPGGPVLRTTGLAACRAASVSILTGPGGPVLRGFPYERGEHGDVSILTGPGGPVLRANQRHSRI